MIIKKKAFYDDDCKSALDNLNYFITEKKLDKTDVINILIEHTKVSVGNPSKEFLVLYYWSEE